MVVMLDIKFMKELQETWKGSGIYMGEMLWHKIGEKKWQEKWKSSGIDMVVCLTQKMWKSYKKNEKVAEYIWW